MSIQEADQHHGYNHRREWSLIILLLLLAVVFMFTVSQYALRILPAWRVSADMFSMIDPDGTIAAYSGGGRMQPVGQQILTPYSYDYLTPGAPDATVTRAAPTSTPIKPTKTATAVPSQAPSLSPTSTVAPTKTRIVIYYTPSFTPTDSPVPPPAATSTFTRTFTPTSTPIATSTPTWTPTTTPTPSETYTPTEIFTATETFTPSLTFTPTDTPIIITANCSNNQHEDINVGPGDGNCMTVRDGDEYIIDLDPQAITLHGNANWDFIYYERSADPGILMDLVTLQISPDGTTWYTVFDFGGGLTCYSSLCGYPEIDNSPIPISVLLGDPVKTGVGIDIDSLGIPDENYRYLKVISPPKPPDSGDGCDVDAIEVMP